MKREDFVVHKAEELPRLVMENEFLSLEARTMRAKMTQVNHLMAEKESLIAQRDETIRRLEGELEEVSSRMQIPEDRVLVDKDEWKALNKAERDLRWTLDRLSRTFLIGPLIRNRPGFARLAEAYLRED